MTLVTRLRLISLSVIVLGIGVFVVANFTGVCRLEAVTYNDQPVEDFRKTFDLDDERPILKQPVDSLTRALLDKNDIVRVDIDYSLPNTIEIRTNQFTPFCFAVDKATSRLVGLTSNGRVVPVPKSQADWERPLITGVGAGKLFTVCDDIRVNILLPQLEKLYDEHPDIFRLVTEIYLGRKDHTLVTVSGLSYRLKLDAEQFLEQIKGFITFVEQYRPNLENTEILDLRYENMIIRVGDAG